MKLSFIPCKWLCLATVLVSPWTANPVSAQYCPRPAVGSIVTEPVDLRSSAGTLSVELHFRGDTSPGGQSTYCYLYHSAAQSPTLRLHPGDVLKLTLFNDLEPSQYSAEPSANPHSHHSSAQSAHASCTPDNAMTAFSTNLHFHGMTISPTCHQDEVLHTVVQPNSPPFDYEIRIPNDAPPGLYWYHPHVHGFSNAQVQGGASGAIIIEGTEKQNLLTAGLPERVLIVRDQNLIHPDAKPIAAAGVPQLPVVRDSEGDIMNTGTDGGKPARDLTLNFVPVAFPEYTPAVLQVQPGKRELWRFLNASSITYLDLQFRVDNRPQLLGVVAMDGAPLPLNPQTHQRVLWMSHILLPPAGRAEFLLGPLHEGTKASLLTRNVDTGPVGENVPSRPLATVLIRSDVPPAPSTIPTMPESANSAPSSGAQVDSRPWLATVAPAHQRKLYFTEFPENPSDPNSRTKFFVTVDGQAPAPFDPSASEPNIVVHQGDVEDWIIENRTRELHAFHIHQIHFLMLEWNSIPLDEPILRDTINVGYWDGHSQQYPSVKLRMDFRDPNIIGTFVYHCHLLEHEDGGMMGTIRVDPPTAP
jgi:FtsP/CotA-like multicopper oxidase with cupredoxin domain